MITSAEAKLLEMQLGFIRENTAETRASLNSIADKLQVLPAMQQAQVNIQMELQRGTQLMADHEKRLQTVERDMPGLKELRRWVIAGVVAGVGMVGTALFKLVIIDVPRFTVPPAVVYHPTPTQKP